MDAWGRRLGIYGMSSAWRTRTEGFRWSLAGDTLSVELPQDGTRTRARVRTWPCRGEAPRPFDLCLEWRSGQKTGRLYSRRAWALGRRVRAEEVAAPVQGAISAAARASAALGAVGRP
jgi:hypothetical protein